MRLYSLENFYASEDHIPLALLSATCLHHHPSSSAYARLWRFWTSPPPPPLGGAPGASSLPSKPPPTIAKDRGALLTDIAKGTRLKKAVTNDRSAPLVERPSGSSPGPPVGGAPSIPGLGKSPTGLAPPVPGAAASNRARSNSDQGSGGGGDIGGPATAPQLGGIFAGVGIPKLRKTGGGIDTGAERDSSYISDPETSRKSASKPPTSFAPKPPTVPRLSALRPPPHTTESPPSAPNSAANPLVTNLRKPPQNQHQDLIQKLRFDQIQTFLREPLLHHRLGQNLRLHLPLENRLRRHLCLYDSLHHLRLQLRLHHLHLRLPHHPARPHLLQLLLHHQRQRLGHHPACQLLLQPLQHRRPLPLGLLQLVPRHRLRRAHTPLEVMWLVNR
ncbi:hypothetical protein ABVK25_000923 [Lepraria finkii]|uniref:WH2 domain-containing protein n=1 Tax=Lepraria finkii TaxID=1340010 RepID=A0ABR4BPB5_9LECA